MDAETEPLVVMGMMGSGKTTVGEALARALGRRYVDNDELVEQATGHTSRQLLRKGGTAAVRAAEAEALRAGLDGAEPTVLGVAAGTILDPALRAMLAPAHVVWLRARPETLARRVLADDDDAEGEHRPWHQAEAMTPEAWLTRESQARAPLYREVADLTVDVDDGHGEDRPVDEIVEDIVEALDAAPGPRRR